MKADGVRRALGFVTPAYSSYCNCRQSGKHRARKRPSERACQLWTRFACSTTTLDLWKRSWIACSGHWSRFQTIGGKRPNWSTPRTVSSGHGENCGYEEQLKETAQLVAETLGQLAVV